MKSRKFKSSGHEIVVIAHNIRSIQNVGSILRTAEGFGVTKVFASGYTPNLDSGLPHVRTKMVKELHKTALGAEEIVDFRFAPDVMELIKKFRADNYRIVGLEQDERAIPLPDFNFCKERPCKKIVLLLGEEVHGLTIELRDVCDALIEIPMFGQKESFNVSVATGIVLYYFTATCSSP
ncbi:TrmH family RNA methyltransferase [Candidatus Saccharibacteria bacterium]|nr:TrmH family RNA methyltransferase [Candidatus Saccharibacteria bacterium]